MKQTKLFASLVVAMGLAGFTACSSGDSVADVTPVQPEQTDGTGDKVTIVVRDGNFGTRAPLTQITDGAEKTVNRVTVGIFNATTGAKISIQEFENGGSRSDAGDAGTKTFTTVSGTTTLNLVTPADILQGGEKVLVAVNIPSGKFDAVTDTTSFKAVTITADQALALDFSANTAQATPVSTNIPMFGWGSNLVLTASNTSTNSKVFATSVNVHHLSAKVSVNNIHINLTDANATFEIEKVYMRNVPNGLYINPDAALTTGYVRGYNKGVNATTNDADYRDYLRTVGTDIFASTDPQHSINNILKGALYFYITPNSQVEISNRTVIYIKGWYDSDGSGSSTTREEVIYPVYLNATYNDDNSVRQAETSHPIYVVAPNKNYICNIEIRVKGIPVDPSNTDEPDPNQRETLDPQATKVTMTVADWTDVNQSTIFK